MFDLQAIINFQEYQKQCREEAKKSGRKWFWSELTDIGLTVSLRSALELSYYLIDKIKFKYVMTKKFNQDALEVIK